MAFSRERIPDALSGVSMEAETAQDVSLSGVFTGGGVLTITAESSEEAIATVTVAADQSRLTVTGVAGGTATIKVTAEDPGGNTVSDEFQVTVSPASQG